MDAWLDQIERLVADIGPAPALDVESADTKRLSRAVAADGFPGILPLWSGRRNVVGLLAMPNVEPRSWPGVIIQDGQGLTIASNTATLLPQLIVQRVLSNSPDAALFLARHWARVREQAFALHRILGGADDAIEAIETVIQDPVARDAFRFRSGAEVAFEHAHSALCRQIDPSDQFRRYADWLDGRIAQQRQTVERAEYGPWTRRVLCWEQRLLSATSSTSSLSPNALLTIIEAHAGVDSAVPTVPTWSVHAGEASGETALVEAAESLEAHVGALDEVGVGLVTALLQEDTSYQGLAHAEAAVALDERGEPIRAWGALQSAAWWMARNAGHVTDAMLDGARSLAERREWFDVLVVVNRDSHGSTS